LARVPKHWKKDWRRIEWASRNWRKLELYTVQRLAEEYAQELGRRASFLHLIRVVVGNDIYFGVSLEPEPFSAPLDEFADRLLIASSSGEDPTHSLMVKESPWVYDQVPSVFSNAEEGYFFVRGSTPEEIEIVSVANETKNQDLGLRPVDPATRTWFVDDVRFNMLRGEFGIGDDGKPLWRPALRRLIKDRLPTIQEEVETAMFKANLNLDVPAFEPRSPEWLDANADFAMMMVQSTPV